MNAHEASDEQALAQSIVERGAACGIELGAERALVLVRHMRRVMHAESSLHLTSIRNVDENHMLLVFGP